MEPRLRPEHQWLQRMVGEWTVESQAVMEAGGQPMTYHGRESVRSLGGLWVVCEGEGEMPGGGTAVNIITLGYNPRRGRFEGTFVGTMMPHMWLYEGQLDASGQRLELETEGPAYTDMERMGRYRDTFEIVSDDHRILSSEYQDDAGQWQRFMTATYRRVR